MADGGTLRRPDVTSNVHNLRGHAVALDFGDEGERGPHLFVHLPRAADQTEVRLGMKVLHCSDVTNRGQTRQSENESANVMAARPAALEVCSTNEGLMSAMGRDLRSTRESTRAPLVRLAGGAYMPARR